MSPCRRQFLKQSLALAGLPAVWRDGAATAQGTRAPRAVVAIGRCRTYADADVRAALASCLDLVGGVAPLVGGKTVTVKVNLTGHEFAPFMNRPVGETYMTHFATVHHLVALLFAGGAKRVRIVESIGRPTPLEATLVEAGWDLTALGALGSMAYENTRNKGSAASYAHLAVSRGRMFSSFEVNRAYEDTDVMVSLAKLKQHETAGVTLTMKNMFGITPSSMYGGKPGDESSIAGRGAIHDPRGLVNLQLPGSRPEYNSVEAGVRVPDTIVDLAAARPVDLAIIDGITSITHAESRYSAGPEMRFVSPGVLIAGRNSPAVDAIGTAIMGFDPRAPRGTAPFDHCENHLLLAERAGLGPADVRRIELRGLSLAEATCPYA
jgi:uncharacterized protein (DUF362 family)